MRALRADSINFKTRALLVRVFFTLCPLTIVGFFIIKTVLLPITLLYGLSSITTLERFSQLYYALKGTPRHYTLIASPWIPYTNLNKHWLFLESATGKKLSTFCRTAGHQCFYTPQFQSLTDPSLLCSSLISSLCLSNQTTQTSILQYFLNW